MPQYRKPEGRPYRRAKAQVRATESVCWLCGGAIDKALRFPHPWSFSVDHVIPVEMGGAQNDRNNMRAAHLRHNQERGMGKAKPPTRQSRQW